MPDRKYMERAIELAAKGVGYVNPNPMVGAVIVKDGRIIGEGYHRKCGELHAERNAFASLTESAEGATIYVTLEPCCHYGKTPPCTEAIIENKIKRVVIGSRDPNPLVSGKGAGILREHGIEVIEDFMREECDKLNPVFFKYIKTKKPYVCLKYAMTIDGKIACYTGKSKWITGEMARLSVQHMRHRYMAIMAGIGTVLADDPMLNVRVEGLKSPVRVIVDSKLRIPTDSNLVKTASSIRTIVATAVNTGDESVKLDSELISKLDILKNNNVEVVTFADNSGRVDLQALLNWLGSEKTDSVLVEGGGTLNESLLRLGLVDRIEAFVAPKVFGGAGAKSPVEGLGVESPSEAAQFTITNTKIIGEDLLITLDKKKPKTMMA